MTEFQQFDISDFFDQMSEPLFMIDSEEIIFFNKYFHSNYELISDQWQSFIDYPEVRKSLKTYFESGELTQINFFKSLKSLSGDFLLFEWSLIALPSSYQNRFVIVKGARSKFYSESMLVQTPENAEKNAKYNLHFLESILNNTHDLITILDSEGNYKFIGPSVGQKLGFKVEDIVGKNFQDFIDAGIIELVKGDFESALQSEEEVNIDFWVHREGEKSKYIESFAKNLLHNPQIQGVIFSARDITDYVQTDFSLQKRFDLENMINKVSALLINESPIDLLKSLKDSFSIVGEFLNAKGVEIHLREGESTLFSSLCLWGKLKKRSVQKELELILQNAAFQKVQLKSIDEECCFILIPMVSNNRLKGLLLIQVNESNLQFDESELQILRQMGDMFLGAYEASKMKSRIERNENLLATTELIAKSGSWRYNVHRKMFHFSGGLAYMFGLGNKPTYAKFSTMIYKIDKPFRKEFITNLRETITSLQTTSGEFTMKSPEDKNVIINYEIDVPSGGMGHQIEVVGICTDVTHKKATEEQLVLQSQILAQVKDPIVVTDLEQELIYANEAALKLCDKTVNDVCKGKIAEFFEFENHEEKLEEIIPKIEEGNIWQDEVNLKIKGNKAEPFEVSIKAIHSDQNQKIGYSLVLQNLSEKYEAKKLANRAKMIVENSPVVLFRIDPNDDFRIVYISDNVARFGYNAQQLVESKKSILDLLYAEDARHIREKSKEIKNEFGVPSFSGSYRFKKGDGSYIWVEDQTQEVRDESGKIQLHEGLILDIDDRKKLEDINEERDRQYRILASNIPGTNVFLLDKERKYIVAEGTNFENWGMTREDFEGKFLWEVHVTPYEEVNALLDQVYYDRQFLESEFAFGDRYYARSFRPIVINDQVEFVLSIIRDITDEHQAKINLLQSEEKYRTLVEESTEIIFSLTEKFELQYVSPNVQQFLGYKASDVIGKSIFEFLNPDDMGEFEKILGDNQDFLAQNQFLEFRLRHLNGDYRVFNSHGKLIEDKEGNPSFYTGIARDVSKLKEAQKELVKAKENAEQASLVKSQFLSIMSHEIRTPMNAVIGLSHLLMQEDPRADQLENLKTLQFSAENLMALINDILDYNKIDSGKVELEELPLDLKNLVTRIVHSHSFQANEKDLRLSCLIDPDLPQKLLGDSVRLGQIINNLLSNAIKFTDKGEVTIKLSHEILEKGICRVNFECIDTGIGVPEDKKESIFEAFTQASSSTTRKYGGTGLGLAIVKRLVNLYGGDIEVNSNISGGSTFKFYADFKIAKFNKKRQSIVK
ncbi:PAS domain S-box protein [Algoriphagus machipongonensis]|uniref:histidine kinase n=1 Tax=Algoriphagus machipongonensis TaxID=388413 RepID=E2RUB5_9BACT|nr:PAS domain S-box protein [Algoriphagus machipongonensis]EFQ79250.1 putative sensory box histidine kinase/response regulator [Algoriphagus machipongonensis]